MNRHRAQTALNRRLNEREAARLFPGFAAWRRILPYVTLVKVLIQEMP